MNYGLVITLYQRKFQIFIKLYHLNVLQESEQQALNDIAKLLGSCNCRVCHEARLRFQNSMQRNMTGRLLFRIRNYHELRNTLSKSEFVANKIENVILRQADPGNCLGYVSWSCEGHDVCNDVFSVAYGLTRCYLRDKVIKVKTALQQAHKEYSSDQVRAALKHKYDWRREAPKFKLLCEFWEEFLMLHGEWMPDKNNLVILPIQERYKLWQYVLPSFCLCNKEQYHIDAKDISYS